MASRRRSDLRGQRLPPFRPLPILETLVRYEVDFVLIGGVAERLLGSPRGTGDIDICPAREAANHERLAAGLNELEAAFRPPGLESGFPPPEAWEARSFHAFTGLALTSRFGWLGIWFIPDGIAGYPELIENAAELQVSGLRLRVASLDDLIRAKEAAGGPKYLSHLPLLRELRRLRRAKDR